MPELPPVRAPFAASPLHPLELRQAPASLVSPTHASLRRTSIRAAPAPAPPCHRRHAKMACGLILSNGCRAADPYGRSPRPEAALGHLPTAERNRRTGAQHRPLPEAPHLRGRCPHSAWSPPVQRPGTGHQSPIRPQGPCSAARFPAQVPWSRPMAHRTPQDRGHSCC